MKRLLGILAITLLIGCNGSLVLPEKFNITIWRDDSSSGASRSYSSLVSFDNDKVVYARRSSSEYLRGGKNICKKEYNPLTDSWTTLEWEEAFPGSQSDSGCGGVSMYKTREEILLAVAQGSIKPEAACQHHETCFKIVEIS